MAMDNPSYFTVSSGGNGERRARTLLRSLSSHEREPADEQRHLTPPPPDCDRGMSRPADEIFYTIPLLGRRRHSAGAYLQARPAPAGRVTAVPSGVPAARAPVHPPAARRKRPAVAGLKQMEDIVILWSNESPESELWSEYLMTCFDKIMSQRARHHYRVTLITCEEILSEPKAEVLEKISKAQLQIVIMCPRIVDKLDKLTDLKPLSPAQDGLFKPDKILIMLLGMERESVIATNEKAYPSIRQWPMKVVKEKDTTFVDSFLTAAVGILRTKDVKTTMEKTCFSIVPKKVKMNQSRVIALLNDPIREEDSIRITVDKKGEQIQIATHKKRNPYTIQFDIPDSCLDVSMLIWIKITKNGQSLGRRQIKCESRLRELDQILRANDHPIEFICQTLGFKTTDKDQLDSWMLASFQKNIPPHFNLLSSPEQYQPKPNASSPEEFPTLLHFAASYGLEKLCWQLLECPGGDAACNLRNARQLTPAELAHAAGFQQLAVILSGHMQMNEFSNMYYYLKNMTENDNITESTEKLMTNLRIVEDSDKQKDVIENNLITPSSEISTDHFSEECLQNLEKNVDLSNHGSKFQYKQVSSPTRKTPTHTYQREQLYENDIVFSSSPIQEEPPFDTVHRAMEHDYLIQPSNIKVECMPPKAVKPQTLYCNISNGNSNRGNQVFLYSPTEETNNFTLETGSESSSLHMTIKNRKNNSCSQSSRENGGLSGQDELAEIINDFKNNVFTISEVEKLVMEWRNRNETQQSLKEKQEQLAKMRDEYERLQQKIKENMKRPTPFDRVRKIFTKGKSKQNNNSGSIEKRNGNHRPNSSLSESSSSSGRLSTVSGGSIGESGTQSDIDEKRVSNNTLASTPTMDHDNIKLDDYLIPPPPRPLNGYPIPSSCPSRFDCPRMPMHMATIVERDNPHATVDNITFHNSREANNNFEANCRRNSLSEEQKRNNSHLYMNIGPS